MYDTENTYFTAYINVLQNARLNTNWIILQSQSLFFKKKAKLDL